MPFATYYRGDMNPRFKTLFDLLEFEDSYSNGDSIILGGNYLRTKKLLKTLIKKK